MKYFLKYCYYIVVGAIFAAILSALIGVMKWELMPIIIVNVFLIRLFDDCFDFVKDKKRPGKQILKKKELFVAAFILSLVYLTLNTVFYSWWGLFSLLLLLYMVIENKHETLKVFFVSVASMYYIGVYRMLDSIPIILYLIIMVVLSFTFYLYKRSKRK